MGGVSEYWSRSGVCVRRGCVSGVGEYWSRPGVCVSGGEGL